MLAERMGVAVAGTSARVRDAVRATGLPLARPDRIAIDDVVRATHGDKKARGGQAEYALPLRIGEMAASDRGWSLPASDALVREILA